MTLQTQDLQILSPIHQLQLFGYKSYFNSFVKLFKRGKLPNTILLSGSDGLGKATFAYHFINYLLSHNEENKYSVSDLTINQNNFSFKKICNGTHPNFYLLENKPAEENIKIENVRNLLNFLNKSHYYANIKIVLIDNAEYLNNNSSNALLKVLEEPNNNTFFFIIHNNKIKILETIKSRCVEFKFFLNLFEKKNIFQKINIQYKIPLNINKIDDVFYYNSPGNILRYFKILSDNNINFNKDKLLNLTFLIDKYKQKKDPLLLSFISQIVELFYNELCLNNINNSSIYFYNKIKILKKIYETKKFNLDKNNLFILIKKTLGNET